MVTGERLNPCTYQRGILLAVFSVIFANVVFFPPWRGIHTTKGSWGSTTSLKMPNIITLFSMDAVDPSSIDFDDTSSPDENMTYGTIEDHWNLSTDEGLPYYNQVYVWDVPPNITLFTNNMYRQWCRWRMARQSKPDALTMDLHTRAPIPREVLEVDSPRQSLIQMNLHCADTMHQGLMGTGNTVQLMYLIRLASAGTYTSGTTARDAFDIQFVCTDDNITEASRSLVFPWLTGRYSSRITRGVLNQYWDHGRDNKKVDFKCHEWGWGNTPVGWMAPFIRYDLRWMAIKLVGLPKDDLTHPGYTWLQRQHHELSKHRHKNSKLYASDARITHAMDSTVPWHPQEQMVSPMIPNVELDDTAIHFRCGDVMASQHGQFRFLKYKEYAKYIDNSTKSIGIITQSFGDANNNTNATEDIQARTVDQDDPYRVALCRAVVEGFANYLQQRFPNARVQIRNGAGETVALAFARLVMARQSFASADSSFAVFPTLASFGVGYHLYPISRENARDIKNEFLIGIAPHLEKNDARSNYSDGKLRFMHVPIEEALYADKTLAMRRENETKAYSDIVRWFRDDAFVFTNESNHETNRRALRQNAPALFPFVFRNWWSNRSHPLD